MKIIASYNIKGGVGKTSAAVNLAALAAMEGRRTLLWDLDPQGSATFLLRVRAKVKGGGSKLIRGRSDVAALLKGTDLEGLDLLPADFSYRHMDLVLGDTKDPSSRLARVLAPLRDDYDVVILDCPPSISLVSETIFDTADVLVVPLIPAALSLRSFEQLLEFVGSSVKRPPGIVAFLSMVDRRKRLHREIAEQLPAEHATVAPAPVPYSSDVEQMGVRRLPVVVSAPLSAAGRAYASLWEHTRRRAGLE
jgi:cellulose biosynthesis protein BcsQ